MATKYAADTSVSVDNSLLEIRRIINRYGADGFRFTEESNRAGIEFRCHGRVVRILLTLPDRNERRFRETETGRARKSEAAWEQECRRSWRALALVIKAKLEAVESGIATFDEEFLSYIVLPDNQTVGFHAIESMNKALQVGSVPALLPRFGDK
jgi:hypothetical protein